MERSFVHVLSHSVKTTIGKNTAGEPPTCLIVGSEKRIPSIILTEAEQADNMKKKNKHFMASNMRSSC